MQKPANQRARNSPFEEEYFRKWYSQDALSIQQERAAEVADFIVSFLRYLRIPVNTVLDAGCGVGHMKTGLLRHWPDMTYVGIDRSQYACRKFGWINSSVSNFDKGKKYDLVVCRNVLQYTDNIECASSIRNISRLTRRAAYIEYITERDARELSGSSCTDVDVFLRVQSWYLNHLQRELVSVGGGLFVHPSCCGHFLDMWRTASL